MSQMGGGNGQRWQQQPQAPQPNAMPQQNGAPQYQGAPQPVFGQPAYGQAAPAGSGQPTYAQGQGFTPPGYGQNAAPAYRDPGMIPSGSGH